MFANLGCAYALWCFLGLFGAHRFYVGRPISGLVWLFTFGLFGVGWVIDVFLIPEFVEEHNKRVFHKQMLESGSSLLFDGGEYGGQTASPGYYPTAAYAQQVYYPQPSGATGGGKGGFGEYY